MKIRLDGMGRFPRSLIDRRLQVRDILRRLLTHIHGPKGLLMPRVVFTGNLQRHVSCQPCAVEGGTVRAALDSAFALYPGVRSYVLDEHGALRAHMVVFVDGQAISDRRGLSDGVSENAEVFVMQALSGG